MSNSQLIEELRWQLRKIEDRKAENQRLLAGMANSLPDQVVTVIVGPDGVVSEVRLAPEAMRLDAVTLGRAITKAIRNAGPKSRRTPADDYEPYDTVFDV